MAKGTSKRSDIVGRAAEAVGQALGSAAHTIDSLQMQHPHPMEEAREALAAVASNTGTRTAAIVKKAKAITRRTRRSRIAMVRVTRTAGQLMERARKAVKSGRKTVRRRLKG